MKISLARAAAIVGKFSGQNILVLGDVMLDRYIYGTVQRISPEAPVPVVMVSGEKNMPGGAANVARNVRALGARAAIAGVIGADQAGRELQAIMRRASVATTGLVRQARAHTTVKMRVIAERQQVVRVDWDEKSADPACASRLCRAVRSGIRGCTGIIIADYAKGVVGAQTVSAALASARARRIPAALDPKDTSDLPLAGLAIATPNRKEAFALAGLPEPVPAADPVADQSLLRANEILMRKWNPGLLVITLGSQGMLVTEKGSRPFHSETRAREVFDVSGAGDTVIAAMLLARAAGASAAEAAELANCAAGVVVGKVGTATCTARELMQFIGEFHGGGRAGLCRSNT